MQDAKFLRSGTFCRLAKASYQEHGTNLLLNRMRLFVDKFAFYLIRYGLKVGF